MSPEALTTGTDAILRVSDLVVTYRRAGGRDRFQAVSGVSLDLRKGETLGVVGESGCGKSTLAQVLMRLIPQTSGSAMFEGKDIFKLKGSALRKMRREIQSILQDPYTSLNPRMTVGHIV